VLPDDWKPGFVLLTRGEIEAVEMRGRYSMALRTEWRSLDEADVTVFVTPAGPDFGLCCFTVVKRYERIDGAWRFVRILGSVKH
jgi:hypothetical protein